MRSSSLQKSAISSHAKSPNGTSNAKNVNSLESLQKSLFSNQKQNPFIQEDIQTSNISNKITGYHDIRLDLGGRKSSKMLKNQDLNDVNVFKKDSKYDQKVENGLPLSRSNYMSQNLQSYAQHSNPVLGLGRAKRDCLCANKENFAKSIQPILGQGRPAVAQKNIASIKGRNSQNKPND